MPGGQTGHQPLLCRGFAGTAGGPEPLQYQRAGTGGARHHGKGQDQNLPVHFAGPADKRRLHHR